MEKLLATTHSGANIPECGVTLATTHSGTHKLMHIEREGEREREREREMCKTFQIIKKTGFSAFQKLLWHQEIFHIRRRYIHVQLLLICSPKTTTVVVLLTLFMAR